jgi:hypothetical protein
MRNLIRGLALITAALATVLAAVLATPAARAGATIDATDPAWVLAAARDLGDASMTRDSMGDPLIEGQLDGKDYRLYFYNCSENRDCRSLMFFAAWEAEDLTDAAMADWNREKRFGKAYIDEDGRAAVEMNVNLHGGVTLANLGDTLGWWRRVLVEFSDFNDF